MERNKLTGLISIAESYSLKPIETSNKLSEELAKELENIPEEEVVKFIQNKLLKSVIELDNKLFNNVLDFLNQHR